jgi:hypothetical protein
VGLCTVFIVPNSNKFVACDPLGHSGAAATTRGRSGALQIENLRHLGSLIETGALNSKGERIKVLKAQSKEHIVGFDGDAVRLWPRGAGSGAA